MPEIQVKRIDKSKSKENYNSTQSQIVIQIDPAPDQDWMGAFNSGWKKTDLGKAAQEVIVNGTNLTVRYQKSKSVEDVYNAVLKAVDQTNNSQSEFHSRIDAINARPLAEMMEFIGANNATEN